MSLDPHGYCIAPHVLTPAECDELAARLGELPPHKAGSRCLLEEPWCRTKAELLRARLAEFFAGELRQAIAASLAIQCTYFHKSPEKNWLVTWHQDRSVPVAERVDSPELTGWSQKEGATFVHAPEELLARMLAVRVHLDDCTEQNGPLRVLAGSHQHGTLAAEAIERLRHETGETACLVPRGGALVLRPLLLHASSKSTSVEPRRVLHFLFAPANPGYGLAWRHAA